MQKGNTKPRANFDVLKRIKEERNIRGWSDYELAKNSGLPQSTLSSWYSKNTEPSLANIEKICEGLNISLSQFFQTSEDNLTDNQRKIFGSWMKLNPDETAVVLSIIELFTRKYSN